MNHVPTFFSGVDCPIGYYGNRTGLTAAVDCTPCDPGYYCPMPGLTAPFGQCEPGHYCKQGANYSTPTDETWGYWCPIGHYCPRGIPTPVPCDMGTYQPDVGKLGRSNVDLFVDQRVCELQHLTY